MALSFGWMAALQVSVWVGVSGEVNERLEQVGFFFLALCDFSLEKVIVKVEQFNSQLQLRPLNPSTSKVRVPVHAQRTDLPPTHLRF